MTQQRQAAIGMGTYRLRGKDAYDAVKYALECGYRYIDTAAVYRNEAEVGMAIRDFIHDHAGMVDRSHIHITSKLAPRDHGEQEAYQACLDSLERLQLTYLDEYLIHWPGKQGLRHDDPQNRSARASSWRALERLLDEGKVRCIGVSNYTVRHLEELLQEARHPPSVLQAECHVLWPQRELVSFCHQHSIHFESYSTLGEGNLINGNMAMSELDRIAKQHQVNTASVLLRWAIDHTMTVVPKSAQPQRIHDNLHQTRNLQLSAEEVEVLDGLNVRYGQKKFCWDPQAIE